MSKHKLSSTQVWVLERLSEGEVLHYLNGIDARCFFHTSGNVSWATIYKLEALGLIKRVDNKVELAKDIKILSEK